ncbi:hypothetical protein PAXINDRAFT_48667, partial [Paxillus involutus ATCC 200175]
VQIFEGHEGWVTCVRFCLDEDNLVTSSNDNALRIWNRTTGAVEVLRGHTGYVLDVDVSRDGKTVVSGSGDKTIRIWNGELGETMDIFEGHEDWVRSVQFSPDSSRVASGSSDSTVRVWSVETGELAFEPIKCRGRVFCVRYSPSGDRIASGASCVQIWNAKTGKQLRRWKAHNNNWIRLTLSPSGSHLATSNWNDNTAFVFDISTGEKIAALKHSTNVQVIAYSPSGKSIATGCEDKKVYLWEA